MTMVEDPPASLTVLVDDRRSTDDLFRFSFKGWDTKSGKAIEGTFNPFDSDHKLAENQRRPQVIWLQVVGKAVPNIQIKEASFKHHDALVHRSPHGAALVLIRHEAARMMGDKCHRIIDAFVIGAADGFTDKELIGFARAGHADKQGELSVPTASDPSVIDYSQLTVAG